MVMDKRLKKEDSDLNNRIDDFNTFVQEMDNKLVKFTSKDSALEGLCVALAHLALIDIRLMLADEDDKRSISLMGVKEE